jgi:hypothetical protein
MAATFGKFKEPNYSSDYTKNKADLNILCINSKDKGKSKSNGKRHVEENCDIYPFNKKNLIVNLYSKIDLQNVKVICEGTNTCENANTETTIDITSVPLYQKYIIDPNGSLFGNSRCSTMNYTEYIVPDIEEDVV